MSALTARGVPEKRQIITMVTKTTAKTTDNINFDCVISFICISIFPPKIYTNFSRPIKYKNYYSKLQIREKGARVFQKGVFGEKMGILVAIRRDIP
jgi:hypothetical protein